MSLVDTYVKCLNAKVMGLDTALVDPYIAALRKSIAQWAIDAWKALGSDAMPSPNLIVQSARLGKDSWAFILTNEGAFYVRYDPSNDHFDICIPSHCPNCAAGQLPSEPINSLAELALWHDKYPAPISTHRCY